MDFSEAYQFTEATPSFSPDGKFIASAVEARCVIRDSETLIVYHMFSCMDKVKHIEWSPTGKHVLCAMYTRSVVQVWDVDDPSWTCKLDAGPAGVFLALSSVPEQALSKFKTPMCERRLGSGSVVCIWRRCSYCC